MVVFLFRFFCLVFIVRSDSLFVFFFMFELLIKFVFIKVWGFGIFIFWGFGVFIFWDLRFFSEVLKVRKSCEFILLFFDVVFFGRLFVEKFSLSVILLRVLLVMEDICWGTVEIWLIILDGYICIEDNRFFRVEVEGVFCCWGYFFFFVLFSYCSVRYFFVFFLLTKLIDFVVDSLFDFGYFCIFWCFEELFIVDLLVGIVFCFIYIFFFLWCFLFIWGVLDFFLVFFWFEFLIFLNILLLYRVFCSFFGFVNFDLLLYLYRCLLLMI